MRVESLRMGSGTPEGPLPHQQCEVTERRWRGVTEEAGPRGHGVGQGLVRPPACSWGGLLLGLQAAAFLLCPMGYRGGTLGSPTH